MTGERSSYLMSSPKWAQLERSPSLSTPKVWVLRHFLLLYGVAEPLTSGRVFRIRDRDAGQLRTSKLIYRPDFYRVYCRPGQLDGVQLHRERSLGAGV